MKPRRSLVFIIVILLLALLGTGVYHFGRRGLCAETLLHNLFSAGTLDINLSGEQNAVRWTNSAPGENYTARINVRNVGTVKVARLYFKDQNYTWAGKADPSNVLEVTYIREFLDGVEIREENPMITLKEFLAKPDWDIVRPVDLRPGSVYTLELGLKFTDRAGNQYQGASCKFSWVVMAESGKSR